MKNKRPASFFSIRIQAKRPDRKAPTKWELSGRKNRVEPAREKRLPAG
jgi:hypothetical protein